MCKEEIYINMNISFLVSEYLIFVCGIQKDNKVCFTTTDEGHIEEGDWANTFKSVVCLGHVEEVSDKEKIYDQLRRLAKRFYPSPESIEKEIESAGSRVKMYVMSIDYMTGKLVHEK